MNKRGQSIIEYTLIAVLVIFGIVWMGPYVLRSINAHFKIWDEGVHDSFSETLNQAPVYDVPDIPLNCKCYNVTGDCGGSFAGSQCPSNERIINHTCNPLLCDGAPAAFCSASDDSCCTIYYGLGCGLTPIPSGDTDANDDAKSIPITSCTGIPATTTVPANASCPSISTTSSPSCYYGERRYATECSDLPQICVLDGSCDPTCLGTIPSNSGIPDLACGCTPGVACNPDTLQNLDQNYPINYVLNASQCNSSIKCQYLCQPNCSNGERNATCGNSDGCGGTCGCGTEAGVQLICNNGTCYGPPQYACVCMNGPNTCAGGENNDIGGEETGPGCGDPDSTCVNNRGLMKPLGGSAYTFTWGKNKDTVQCYAALSPPDNGGPCTGGGWVCDSGNCFTFYAMYDLTTNQWIGSFKGAWWGGTTLQACQMALNPATRFNGRQ